MEELSVWERGLMQACLAWTPGKGLLEHDPRVQEFIARFPDQITVVRKLQLLLLHGRLAGGQG